MRIAQGALRLCAKRLSESPNSERTKPRLAYLSLGSALKATTRRFRRDFKLGIKPPGAIDLTEDQLENLLHLKKKHLASKAMALAAAFSCIVYCYGLWNTPIEKQKYIYDRYGRRIDPETGAYVPRLF